VLAREKIMGWTPDFHTPTFAGETLSLISRSLVSYLLGTVNLFWRIATEIYSLGEFQSLLHHSAR